MLMCHSVWSVWDNLFHEIIKSQYNWHYTSPIINKVYKAYILIIPERDGVILPDKKRLHKKYNVIYYNK